MTQDSLISRQLLLHDSRLLSTMAHIDLGCPTGVSVDYGHPQPLQSLLSSALKSRLSVSLLSD